MLINTDQWRSKNLGRVWLAYQYQSLIGIEMYFWLMPWFLSVLIGIGLWLRESRHFYMEKHCHKLLRINCEQWKFLTNPNEDSERKCPLTFSRTIQWQFPDSQWPLHRHLIFVDWRLFSLFIPLPHKTNDTRALLCDVYSKELLSYQKIIEYTCTVGRLFIHSSDTSCKPWYCIAFMFKGLLFKPHPKV